MSKSAREILILRKAFQNPVGQVLPLYPPSDPKISAVIINYDQVHNSAQILINSQLPEIRMISLDEKLFN